MEMTAAVNSNLGIEISRTGANLASPIKNAQWIRLFSSFPRRYATDAYPWRDASEKRCNCTSLTPPNYLGLKQPSTYTSCNLGPLAPSVSLNFSWLRVTSEPLSNNANVSTGIKLLPLARTLTGTTLRQTRPPVPVAAVTAAPSPVTQLVSLLVSALVPSWLSWLESTLGGLNLLERGVAVCCVPSYIHLLDIWTEFGACSLLQSDRSEDTWYKGFVLVLLSICLDEIAS